MVRIEDLSVGDKVYVVSAWPKGGRQSGDGKMDRYLGSVMTVVQTLPEHDYAIMAEDQHQERTRGWCWYAELLDCIVDEAEDEEEDGNELSAFLGEFINK